ILLLASACSRANEPQLEVVHRILDVAPQPAAGDAVGWCELESEVRPAIGCLPKFPGSIAKLEVADSPLRRRLAVPEAARGGPILVESRLVFAGGGRPTFLPAFVVREPAGETIDVELTIPSAAPKKSARLEYRLRPLPPAVREYASAEIDVPRGAVLEVGVAVDPLARWVDGATYGSTWPPSRAIACTSYSGAGSSRPPAARSTSRTDSRSGEPPTFSRPRRAPGRTSSSCPSTRCAPITSAGTAPLSRLLPRSTASRARRRCSSSRTRRGRARSSRT